MEGPRLIKRGPVVVPPYGSRLVDLVAEPERVHLLRAAAHDVPALQLSARELADLEMLATGAFSPLAGFMGKADHESVCRHGRLADGRLWPLPVMLTAPVSMVERLAGLSNPTVSLFGPAGNIVAAMTVTEMWEPDRQPEPPGREAAPDQRIFGAPPGRAFLAGRVEMVESPAHPDFAGFRRTPVEMRDSFEQLAMRRWVAYRPRGLLHRAHVETLRRFGRMNRANVLILGAVGATGPMDRRYHARVRAWRAALEQYPAGSARLNIVEYVPRPAGVAAEILNAIVARNFGATHYVVEHDYDTINDEPRYGEFSVQEHLFAFERELGVEMVLWRDMVYEEDRPEEILAGRPRPGRYVEAAAHDETRAAEIARWFSYPAVLQEWQKPLRASPARGLTIFLTGLPGAGKSMVARRLAARLMEVGEQHVVLLDDPDIEADLSPGLGAARAELDAHARRLGRVASIVTEQRGIAICAPTAPGAGTRAAVRALVVQYGAFVEVHVATPAGSEPRDLYRVDASSAAAARGRFDELSYEPPVNPEVTIDMRYLNVVQAVEQILMALAARGLMRAQEAWISTERHEHRRDAAQSMSPALLPRSARSTVSPASTVRRRPV